MNRFRSLSTLAFIVLMALLAGCGVAGPGNGGGTTTGGGHPTATPAVTLPCSGTPAAPSRPPSVTLRNADSGRTVSIAVGAVVEIRLDGKHVWHLDGVQPASALTVAGASGALEQGDCVWDFAVAQPGDATVSFVGGALCQPGQACPMYAILARFTIHAS